jgi:X-Pro dipeptidyl-peptidase (S15 family)/X-Pro dipeptidyl-peptidase C-terminal non-catalytic domain
MRGSLAAGGVMVAMLAGAGAAHAEVPDSLKSSCITQTPHPGYSFKFCNDGLPPVAGLVPNVGAVNAVRVPAKYAGFEELPPKAADAATTPGADPDGYVALDVDVSIPTTPPPAGGYPLIAFMHGCCAGTKTDWERGTFDSPREHWHYNNAWFASRGYVVLNYTARGFRNGTQGSTGQTQLDSRQFEINDFQYLAGLIADDSFFSVNPQKVVATGGSYGGGFSWLALTDPKWSSPGGRDMKLAAVAPRYGWTDLVYSLIPNGRHSQQWWDLPAFDGSDTTDPLGTPKQSLTSVLFGSGFIGTTFPPYIVDAFTCLNQPDPYETNPLCQSTINNTLPEFISDRSAYYQNGFFKKIARNPSYRIPVFNAATLTDPLFTPIENLRMSNRLHRAVRNYPIQQYFGDYEHFVQNKAKEWGDVCGADHHVCNLADYAGGDVNATPNGLLRTGVTTRLNKFIDYYAQPSGDPSPPRPKFDVTASLQICPQNADANHPADEPGDTYTGSRFSRLAPYNLRLAMSGDQSTVNDAEPNPHATQADPIVNAFFNGSRCPVATAPAGPGVAVYDGDPLASTVTMIGATTLSIDYDATTSAGLQLNSRLYDVFPDGTAVMVDRGVWRATDAHGTVTYELHGNGGRFPAGHKIRIEVAQDDAQFVKPSAIPSSAVIHGVRLEIPIREPQRSDFPNAIRFCLAERYFLGEDAFSAKYGGHKWGSFFKCIVQNWYSNGSWDDN